MNDLYNAMIQLCAESDGGAVLRSIDGRQYIAAHVSADGGTVRVGDDLVLFIEHDSEYDRDNYVLSPFDEAFNPEPEYQAVTDAVIDPGFGDIIVARALNGR